MSCSGSQSPRDRMAARLLIGRAGGNNRGTDLGQARGVTEDRMDTTAGHATPRAIHQPDRGRPPRRPVRAAAPGPVLPLRHQRRAAPGGRPRHPGLPLGRPAPLGAARRRARARSSGGRPLGARGPRLERPILHGRQLRRRRSPWPRPLGRRRRSARGPVPAGEAGQRPGRERFSIDGSWLLDDDGKLYLYRCLDFVDQDDPPHGTGIVVQAMRDPFTPIGPPVDRAPRPCALAALRGRTG